MNYLFTYNSLKINYLENSHDERYDVFADLLLFFEQITMAKIEGKDIRIQ